MFNKPRKGVVYALQGAEREQIANMLSQQAMLRAQLMGILQLFIQRERIPTDGSVVFDQGRLAFVHQAEQSK